MSGCLYVVTGPPGTGTSGAAGMATAAAGDATAGTTGPYPAQRQRRR